jgi:hypothetical protein
VRLSRFSIIGSLMALAFALMAILPVLAATATIEIGSDYVSDSGTFKVEIEDQDLDTTVVKEATLMFDGGGYTVAGGGYFGSETNGVTQFNLGPVASGGTGLLLAAEGIDGIPAVINDMRYSSGSSKTADIDESTNFNVDVFDADLGLINVTSFAALGSATNDTRRGSKDIANDDEGSGDGVKYWILMDVTIASLDTLLVKITSVSDKTGISVTATESGLTTGIFKVSVDVSGSSSSNQAADFAGGPDNAATATGSYDVNPSIWGAPGETLTATYKDVDKDGDSEGTRTATVVVESNKPSVTVVSPADKLRTTDTTPDLTVDVTDLDSGMSASTINFNILTSIGGASASTQVDGYLPPDVTTTAITNGFRAVVTLGDTGTQFTDNFTVITWNATATDDAGNLGTSDSGTDLEHNIIIIDQKSPVWTTAVATAGFWFDVAKDTVSIDVSKSSSTSIGIKFANVLTEWREELDIGTVSITDFEIDDLDLIGGTSVSGITPLTATVYPGFERWIFLTVNEMAPESTPDIELVSGISDSVGNTTSTGEITAIDGQAPTLTISLSDALNDDDTTVTITSNEALAANPTVGANLHMAGNAFEETAASASVEATNSWEFKLDPAQQVGPFSIVVSAKDTAQNAVTVGEAITVDDWPTSKSLVFYSDNRMLAAVVDPANDAEPELAVPFFVTLDFTKEGAEYGLIANGTVTADASLVITDLDVHETVTVTAITLDDVDVSSLLDTQDNVVFTLAFLDIATGEHTLEYTAEDQAGNDVEDIEIDFEVKARKAYKVAMAAGWNLISLPGTPADTAISSVIPSDHPATNVLSFTGGAWSVATRPAGGAWEGSLTTVDGLHAYWVNTSSSAPVESLLQLPAAGTANTLPTVAVSSGWNLVPVIDLAQTKQGSGADQTGAAYFTSISWSVAYTYAAQTRAWTRVTPSNGAKVTNGDGVWVWATRAGTLIP